MKSHLPPELLESAAEIFNDALELPRSARDGFVERACAGMPAVLAEVNSLLAAHERSEGFPEPSGLPGMAEALDSRDSALVGERMGAYRILREIGRGGMATVYLAQRADGQFDQRVALKLVRAGIRPLLARFLRERRILARLEHPNIARLLDGGATADGRPFLVMEYVEGEPLTAYCDHRRLTIEARLGLFLDACAAVQHAHRNLVVHLDLKPANILVTAEGRVKLLDFGIARLLEPEPEADGTTLTSVGIRAMTPEYAAPEQIRGEPVTTATDVYALGAVFYELLTGHRPRRFETRTLEAMVRVFNEAEPRPPSVLASRPAATGRGDSPGNAAAARASTPDRLRRRLRGDLDAIALAALRTEPERRYPSVAAFHEDVKRHLGGLPVTAHRGTLRYRAGRFMRRHRTGVAAGALVVTSLLAGLTAATWQAGVAARERDQALREADKAARVTSFMSDLFFLADPGQARGQHLTVREAVDSGRVWIEREFTGQPELYLEIAHELGELHYRLGLYPQARELWETALAHGIASGGEVRAPVLRVMLLLAKVLEDLGLSDSAEVLARRALVIHRQLPELRNDAAAETHVLARLGNALRHQGRLEESEAVIREALAILPPDHPDAPHRRTVLLTTLAHVRRAAGDPAGAETLLREILRTRRATWGDEHPEVAQVLTNLGDATADQGRYAEAESLFRQGLEMRAKTQGETHADYAVDLGRLARVYRLKGDLGTAQRLYGQALELQRRALPPSHPRIRLTQLELAEVRR